MSPLESFFVDKVKNMRFVWKATCQECNIFIFCRLYGLREIKKL